MLLHLAVLIGALAATPPIVADVPVECRIPRDTVVQLELAQAIDSSAAAAGDGFRLTLVDAIKVNGVTVIDAGIGAAGEVIHAARAKGAGKAGELIVTARYLEHRTARLRLRGFQLGVASKSEAHEAFAVAMLAGPIGFVMKGGEAVLPIGRRASARLTEDAVLPGACPARQ